jgi:hypothetical protein
MKLHRIIILICVLLAAATAAVPVAAQASSLLSGYGGPGQGSQAILGSALLNGPKGGGGSGGAGSAAASGAEGSTRLPAAPATQGSSSGSHPSAPAGKGTSGAHGGTSRAAGTDGREAARTIAAAQRSFYPAAERVPSGDGSGALGLTGADLIYIILAVGVLVSLGVLTRRVSADPREGAGG